MAIKHFYCVGIDTHVHVQKVYMNCYFASATSKTEKYTHVQYTCTVYNYVHQIIIVHVSFTWFITCHLVLSDLHWTCQTEISSTVDAAPVGI